MSNFYANTLVKPMKGLRVVELARVLAGPWIGQTLADLGADVIKVEAPSGDETRAWGPPWIESEHERTSAYYHSCNRGKRSVVLDLKSEQGHRAALKLLASADIAIENFKVGGLSRLGLGWEQLRTLNPRLIMASVTGFGQDGPRAKEAGYDYMIQAMSGIMSLTGEPESQGGQPMKMGVAFADIFTGLYGVIAIQSALLRRQQTGEGAFLDLSLYDSMLGVLANQAQNYLASGTSPTRMGNAHPNLVPYQPFACRDGQLVIACGNDRQFGALCQVLGLEPLPTWADSPGRLKDRLNLIQALEAKTATWTKAQLQEALKQQSVPCGPIHSVAEALGDAQALHRQMLVQLGGVDYVRSPLMMDGQVQFADRPAPALGQHTDEVLSELKLD